MHDDDIKSLMPKLDMTRRGFVSAAVLATGYAMAVSPAAADAIVTDTKGLKAGAVMIPSGADSIPAYAAMPEGKGPFPTILVVQEIFGVHEYIRDVCRRLAKLGYLAVAPELYVRQGDPSKITDIPTILSNIVTKVADEQVMADLDATAVWAAKNKGDPKRLGITGFCWGGRIVWLYAAHNPKLKAGVAWYGRLAGDSTVMTPDHPLSLAAKLKAPVLGLYGGADQGIPFETVEKMREAVKAGKMPVEIVVYPDAPHAFHADYRPSYREGPAKDGWARLVKWLKGNSL
ncbi:carboxymethylenebutenolidase [Paramagnetospirillum kuznetsovii]|uniref:Carboxymethylenebutenolidase n=1 Tax=Paramagnetospirillum kuznetsovii TaxID=2053833 RepID=A0A364NXK9_9PROT|nr:dienelactone hydrolase family protein [Paramagnetospirillum kuznetsovii]RAU21637.1 carboxymethylenebutenolidase [Paramagnetospirillum kuznetsovii]